VAAAVVADTGHSVVGESSGGFRISGITLSLTTRWTVTAVLVVGSVAVGMRGNIAVSVHQTRTILVAVA
jgi:hypothetical protein